MTTLARIVAYGLGLVVVAFVVLLAVAGVPAAGALIFTTVGVVAMIALGGVLGGRSGRQSRPRAPGASGCQPGDGGGTMER